MPTADLGFAWAVKESFVHYVASMPDGRIAVGDGAAVTSTEQFYFPFVSARAASDGVRSYEFEGFVHFVAHDGMLSLDVRRPRIDIGSNSARLSIQRTADEWLHLGDIALPEAEVDDSVTMWREAAVGLTTQGATLFAGTYRPGEPLAQITIRVPTASAR